MGGRSPLHAARRAHRVPVLALLEAALGAIILAAGLAVALTSAGSACATEDPSPPPPPPLAPGFAYATLPGTELTFDLTLGGSVDDFDAGQLEAKLRPELGCAPEWCTLTFPSVVAASVRRAARTELAAGSEKYGLSAARLESSPRTP